MSKKRLKTEELRQGQITVLNCYKIIICVQKNLIIERITTTAFQRMQNIVSFIARVEKSV